MQSRFNPKQLPRASAVYVPAPPLKKGDGSMTEWKPLEEDQRQYVSGCCFITNDLRTSLTHYRYGYYGKDKEKRCLFCLGQFETAARLQYPVKIIELKWWLSTTAGEPNREQVAYIRDIDDIDMAALINLFDLDINRMNHLPLKGVDELQQMIDIKLKEIAKLQKRIKSNNESMSVNLASESQIRPDLFPENQFDDFLDSNKITFKEIIDARILSKKEKKQNENPILKELNQIYPEQNKVPRNLSLEEGAALSRPIRLYEKKDEQYDNRFNSDVVSYNSKQQNEKELMNSQTNEKRKRIEIDLDNDDNNEKINELLVSPKKKNSPKKNSKKVFYLSYLI